MGKKEHVAGNRYINATEEDVLQTLDKVFEGYKKYGAINETDIKGKRILEIGPGDSFGIGLKFLFLGAKSVVFFDKFYARRDEVLLKEVYRRMLLSQNKYTFDHLFDNALLPKNHWKYIYGKGIEQISATKDPYLYQEPFDYIISNQVIQEVYALKPAFKRMIDLLAIGGKMVHHIDFEPYNYFRYHLDQEYDFLTFSEITYKWMVNKRGMSNRKRINEYIRILDSFKNIKYQFFVYSCFLDKKKMDEEYIIYPNFPKNIKDYYEPIISKQKPNFANKYKKLPIENFMVGNTYLVIEKMDN
ncbi:hypothetical protein RQM59_06065 [Flavobacteriaceae bacterium S356]|uniref:Methyltransferase n=1 Tax=Asprobacillus argus TaxID=3076534 RepID=A0ABU3LE07_9FLAO|nr:hypothetical protein [Flavobacteriaceae bacterium S356]